MRIYIESRQIVKEIVESAMMLIKSQPFQCIQVSTYITSRMLKRSLSAKCVYGDLKYYGTLLFKNALTCHFEDAPSSNFDGHAWVEWDNNGVSYIIDASILFTVFSDEFQRAKPKVFYVFQQKFGATRCIVKTQEEVLQSGLEHTLITRYRINLSTIMQRLFLQSLKISRLRRNIKKKLQG